MTDKVLFACAHCDTQYSKWQGQCSECGKWGTIKASDPATGAAGEVVSLAESAPVERLSLGNKEIENVLGGGLVPGSLLLLAGDPGIGKSTLVLQLAAGVLTSGQGLYVCGEESPTQIGMRLKRLRLNPASFGFLADTNLKNILATIRQTKPDLVVVDSIQTIASTDNDSEPGSVTQIRLATVELLQLAKQTHIPIIVIGHVTKDGSVAGPRVLEHLVDVVLYLEGDGTHQYRLLRSVKNRFGPTNQVGVFTMGEQGLEEVANPSELFLNKSATPIPGSAVSVIMEGARPFLIEIQALTNKTSFGYPKRAASGFELSRLELLVAVLERRGGLKLQNQDIFLNVVGGLKVKDPALDLAASLAIASALSNQPLPERSIVLGEIGLGGEVRPVSLLEARVREAERLGFKDFYVPEQKITGAIKPRPVASLISALAVLGIDK